MTSSGVESKWLGRWKKAGVFESNPDLKRPKYFLTVPYPYASGALHVGHARSYTLGDVTARYKRMAGFNVLFPMASHITGTPILAISRKVEQGDKKAIEGNKEYVSFYESDKSKVDEIVAGFTKPENVAEFYANAIKQDFEDMGYAIDWRRFFTTGDRQYNAFIRWQYLKLKEKGFVMKGKHAVYYCPNCGNPVTTDDIKSGDEYEIGMNELYLIKMKFQDGFLVAATLRPETVFGIVNTWINPNENYVKASVDNEIWYVAEKFVEKYSNQQHEVRILEKFRGSSLAGSAGGTGKKLTVPIVNREVPLLEAEFVDVDIATGVVNSVPAHAPYDYIAGEEVMAKQKIDIKPISLIKIDGYSEIPAKDLVEREGIKSQTEHEKLEKVTQELYKDEYYRGITNENCGEFSGLRVMAAKERVIEKLKELGQLTTMHEMNIKDKDGQPIKEPKCRCGTDLVIKVLADQWFLNYGDIGWKEITNELLLKIAIEPEMYRRGFEHTIQWLHEWPCTRNRGLGTKLPFDERWMIESLSDSTIYMAYYTIAHNLTAGKLSESQLKPEFFDFVFLGIGSAMEVSKKTGIDPKLLEKIHAEFSYWYPMDERRTGIAHISNHLTFMMFHHAAVFPSQFWPKKISLNEMLIAEGRKMSKSLGNVIPIHSSIKKYGADVVRLYLVYAADPDTTLDWRENQVENARKKLSQFQEFAEKAIKAEGASSEFDIDIWMKNRLAERTIEARKALDNSNARKAVQSALYDLLADINWYQRRAEKPNSKVMSKLAESWVKLMAPFTPFTCEELWEKMGKKTFVLNEKYPEASETAIDKTIDARENYLKNLLEDVQNILKIMKKTPTQIHFYLSPDWKYKVYNAIKEGKQMKDLVADSELRQQGKEIAKIMQTRKEELPEVLLERSQENETLTQAKTFLEKELNMKITIQEKPTHDPEQKSKYALPMKPGIYME
ncbi:MAG: leucine--tRNA ligase [Candidatus Altiarchaeales archaeon]|nr:leucine--tRNA ligase [Candidatus Altiarchaeales archaeon]